jgi:hypothetical protein
MPKHPGQKIGQRDADHEKNGQTKIHFIIMDRAARATLTQINHLQNSPLRERYLDARFYLESRHLSAAHTRQHTQPVLDGDRIAELGFELERRLGDKRLQRAFALLVACPQSFVEEPGAVQAEQAPLTPCQLGNTGG